MKKEILSHFFLNIFCQNCQCFLLSISISILAVWVFQFTVVWTELTSLHQVFSSFFNTLTKKSSAFYFSCHGFNIGFIIFPCYFEIYMIMETNIEIVSEYMLKIETNMKYL